MGFKLNPYDPCVAKSQIKGKQCTDAWYVDDNKISHVDDTVVTDVIEKIEAKFGKMTVTRGKHHLFLGMKITFNDDATVTLLMKEYIKEAIADSGMDASRVAVKPAKRDLFAINDKSEHLERKKAELFHSIVAKLLYVSKPARTDLQLAVAFLCTRVLCSTEQDRDKLVRLLQYLNAGTLDLALILGADSLNAGASWVDASYAVHDNMKSYFPLVEAHSCASQQKKRN